MIEFTIYVGLVFLLGLSILAAVWANKNTDVWGMWLVGPAVKQVVFDIIKLLQQTKIDKTVAVNGVVRLAYANIPQLKRGLVKEETFRTPVSYVYDTLEAEYEKVKPSFLALLDGELNTNYANVPKLESSEA